MIKQLMIISLICSSISVLGQKTNFSGAWAIDTTKTAYGDAPQWVIPFSIIVEQQSDRLSLTRINRNENQETQSPVIETLLFDGTPFNRTPQSVPVVTTSLSWTDDHSFILTRQGTVTATETWSLADDGKTLVIDRHVKQGDNLEYEIKCHYTKQ